MPKRTTTPKNKKKNKTKTKTTLQIVPEKPLWNPQQGEFIDEYMFDFNATKAAERALYKTPRQAGSHLLSIPVIKAEILRRLSEKSRYKDKMRLFVLTELCLVAGVDFKDIASWGGRRDS